MEADKLFSIAGRKIGIDHPAYFIADIAANHDGDLERAKDLISLAAESGADAAKFQHFKADTIVSDAGFKAFSRKQSHQAKWVKSVYEVYQDASVSLSWTPQLKATCDAAGIDFITSPYAFDLVDAVDSYVTAYKIGSGDITWLEIIEYIAAKNKPYILATGASTEEDVRRAVEIGLRINPRLALLQCNTNYTASLENFRYIHLNVLQAYRRLYPGMVLGLSDHTPGHVTVLGAVALGARIIEKHFTDDTRRTGPDHAFSMNPHTWREMVIRTRELELALGSSVKTIQDNEAETVVLQRRSIRLGINLDAGTKLLREHMKPLRPCPADAVLPRDISLLLGRKLRHNMKTGDYIRWIDIE